MHETTLHNDFSHSQGHMHTGFLANVLPVAVLFLVADDATV